MGVPPRSGGFDGLVANVAMGQRVLEVRYATKDRSGPFTPNRAPHCLPYVHGCAALSVFFKTYVRLHL